MTERQRVVLAATQTHQHIGRTLGTTCRCKARSSGITLAIDVNAYAWRIQNVRDGISQAVGVVSHESESRIALKAEQSSDALAATAVPRTAGMVMVNVKPSAPSSRVIG